MSAELMLVCPHCGGEDIGGNDVIDAVSNIQGWARDADGTLEPVWTGDTDVDWDSQRPVDQAKPYICLGCMANLCAEELAEPQDEDEEEAA